MNKKKLIVLIVDDNKIFVGRIISLLEETDNIGFVNVAFDYDEGLSCFEKMKPDIVLLDINLPGKSGIELLRAIKESGQPCSTIMISNHHNEYYRQLCKQLGAEQFLDKSTDFGMVPSIIRQMGSGN